MIKILAPLFSATTIFALLAVVAGTLIPGPHRALAPGSFGLVEIAPKIWTDAPDQANRLRALIRDARAAVAAFFTDAPPDQTIILCSTTKCAQDFGIRGNGLSIPRFAIIVSRGGLTIGTLTHELTHARLHRHFGPRNLIRQPFPTWFDEGLATHVAQHPLQTGAASAQARARVRQVMHFWQWDDAYRALGVGRAYTAAAAEVAQIEAQAGRAGLLSLIARAEAGERFDTVLADITP